MDENIYLCYKHTLTSKIAASLVFERLRNNGYSVLYSRKLRDNDFIKRIEKVIEPIIDVIVLLDNRSFMALEESDEKFMESWFGRELLEVQKQNKHIVVICLNGYSLPEKNQLPQEMHFLYRCQINQLDTYKINVSESINELVGELLSKPKLKYMIENNVSFENSSDFLIYSDGDCNVYEYGYLIATIDSNVDKHHPFKYTVNRSGQHYFYAINNDSGQTQELSFEIAPCHQKYIYIQWDKSKMLDDINVDDIAKEKDCALLYDWGKSFFFGNPKHKPNYDMALDCFLRSAELGNPKAMDFICKYDHSLASIFKVPMAVAERWYKEAAKLGSPEAWMKMGEQKETQCDYCGAKDCYMHALKYGHIMAESALARIESQISAQATRNEDYFLVDFHNIVENFRRQIGSRRIGKFKREVKFESIVKKMTKIEAILRDPNFAKTLSAFTSDSNLSKYHNRMFAFIGYLAQRTVFDNLSHKDILNICIDEQGENQSEVKAFRKRMGEQNLKESNIAKMADRMITGRLKKSLDRITDGWLLT